MGNSVRAISVGLLATSALGCAWIIHGPRQVVEITSTPPGAKVTILPGGKELTTPCEAELQRRKVHTVLFELEGYRPATGYLDRTNSNATAWNLVFAPFGFFGFFGAAIDQSTGAVYRLVPDMVHADLVPVGSGEIDTAED